MLRNVKNSLLTKKARRHNRGLKPIFVTFLYKNSAFRLYIPQALAFGLLKRQSPMASFILWKTILKLWKTCGEGVEKTQFLCGIDVE